MVIYRSYLSSLMLGTLQVQDSLGSPRVSSVAAYSQPNDVELILGIRGVPISPTPAMWNVIGQNLRYS